MFRKIIDISSAMFCFIMFQLWAASESYMWACCKNDVPLQDNICYCARTHVYGLKVQIILVMMSLSVKLRSVNMLACRMLIRTSRWWVSICTVLLLWMIQWSFENIYTRTARSMMNSWPLMMFITQWTSVSSEYLYISCNYVCDWSSDINGSKT